MAAAVSFARHYIANPDLVERFQSGAELAAFDRKALYSTGPQGYSDYPAQSAAWQRTSQAGLRRPCWTSGSARGSPSSPRAR